MSLFYGSFTRRRVTYLCGPRDLKDLHCARDDVLHGLLSDPAQEHRGDLSESSLLRGLLARSRRGAGEHPRHARLLRQRGRHDDMSRRSNKGMREPPEDSSVS